MSAAAHRSRREFLFRPRRRCRPVAMVLCQQPLAECRLFLLDTIQLAIAWASLP
jgi:hypothetical protein